MRDNLDILLIIKRAYEENRIVQLKSGLCAVLAYLTMNRFITPVENAKIYDYLKRKYNPRDKLTYWWPHYEWEPRYKAICDCIQEEKANTYYCCCDEPILAHQGNQIATSLEKICAVCQKPFRVRFGFIDCPDPRRVFLDGYWMDADGNKLEDKDD